MIAERRPRLAFIAAWAAAALMLLWPVALNRDAFVFPDTVNYLSAGRRVWALVVPPAHAATPPVAVGGGHGARPKSTIGGRSPFYGAVAWAGFVAAGVRGIAVIHALWLAAALLLAFGHLGLRRWRWRLAAVAALAFGSTTGFFAATAMPDAFAALGPLALALLWFAGGAMARGERAFWAGTLLAAALFHVSILIVVALLAVGLGLAARRQPGRREAVTVAGVLAAAAVASIATTALASRMAHTRVVPTPFLLARVIGDGPGAQVLASDCPTRHWTTCRFLPGMPMTENGFLWESVVPRAWVGLLPDERAAIAAEQGPILAAVATRYPLTQLGRSLGNVVAQLGTVGLGEFQYRHIVEVTMSKPEFAAARARYAASAVAHDRLSLAPLATAWQVVAAAAAAASLVVLALRRRLGIGRTVAAVAATLLAAIVVNAAVNGVVSGVFGRYGAREEWLAPLALIALLAGRRAAVAPVQVAEQRRPALV